MNWITFAILSAFLWASTNIFDKYAVANRVTNPYAYLLIQYILSGLIVFLLILFFGISLPNPTALLMIFLTSLCWFLGTFPYMKAIEIEDVTRINMLWNTIPIFAFFMAWFFLGEHPSPTQIFAIILLIIGGVLASIKIDGKIFHLSNALWLMLLASLAVSVNSIIIKYAGRYMSTVEIFIWMRLFLFLLAIFTVVLFRRFRKITISATNRITFFTVCLILISTFATVFASFINFKALETGIVAAVDAITESSQMLFVFFLTIPLTFIFKLKLKEKMDFRNILIKIFALVVISAGLITL